MFSRDVKHFSYRTPRTLQSSKFGPYSRISIPTRRTRVMPFIWMLGYGFAIGACWYALLIVRSA